MNTLTKEQLRERIIEYILKTSHIKKKHLTDDLHFFEEGIFDSMEFALFLQFLTDEFSIEVLEDELTEENFKSIASLLNYLDKKFGVS
jgi:acyl carrier protein